MSPSPNLTWKKTILLTLNSALLMSACQAKLAWSQHAPITTVYVVPSGQIDGTGAADSPFVLTAGKEYLLNQVIATALDKGLTTRVLFQNGLYYNVRLQIIKAGYDTDTIYLKKLSNFDEKSISNYYNTDNCNKVRENCRVRMEDFAVDQKSNTALELVAQERGKVIFDGTDTSDNTRDTDSEALLISGSVFGRDKVYPYESKSERISNVTVDGLKFQNFKDGIHVRYARNVTIKNIEIQNTGAHSPRKNINDRFGTFAIRVDGDSELILFYHNTVTDTWNSNDSSFIAKAINDPGLIHSIYNGYSKDVIFRENVFTGSSGPVIKFGYYPFARGKDVVEFPTGPKDRRTIFVGNKFILNDIQYKGINIPIYYPQQAFIEDNSRMVLGKIVGSPAAGVVFVANHFENRLAPDAAYVAFLRQELPPGQSQPNFPGWMFRDNCISGVVPESLVVDRERGTSMSVNSIRRSVSDRNSANELLLLQQNCIHNKLGKDSFVKDDVSAKAIAYLVSSGLINPMTSLDDQKLINLLRSR